jgi:hypothetical protein
MMMILKYVRSAYFIGARTFCVGGRFDFATAKKFSEIDERSKDFSEKCKLFGCNE